MPVMEGQGFYNQHSRPQSAAAAQGYPLLERAAGEVPLERPRIVDFGCSQGANSMEPMRRAIAKLKERHAGAIEVVHVDQPQNDFNSLFQLLAGPESYLQDQVYASACAGTFYARLFPERSIALGWSSIALHWLSRVPGPLKHLWPPLDREPWKEQAALDWRTFIAHRRDELEPGGQLVIVGSGADPEGMSGAEGLMRMAQDCLNSPAQIPCYYRTTEEWLAPLKNRLLEVHEVQLEDPLWTDLQRTGDQDAYARQMADFFRAAFHSSILPPEGFYPRLIERIRARPEEASCHWRLVLLRIG